MASAATKLISVDEYHRMIEAGVLTTEDRVELLAGRLEPKMPNNPPHRRSIERTFYTLLRIIPPGWYATMQQPITTDESEPEPDVAVIRGTYDDYADRHPGPADVALLVEVAGSSLATDRRTKGRIYGRAGVACYWIVNLVDDRVEVHDDPTGPDAAPGYRRQVDYGRGEAIPLLIDGREVGRVAVADILP